MAKITVNVEEVLTVCARAGFVPPLFRSEMEEIFRDVAAARPKDNEAVLDAIEAALKRRAL